MASRTRQDIGEVRTMETKGRASHHILLVRSLLLLCFNVSPSCPRNIHLRFDDRNETNKQTNITHECLLVA